MPTVGEIQRAYQGCLDQAKLWLDRHAYGVANKAIRVVVEKSDGGDLVIGTSETLHLRDWPYRGRSRKRIDVLATIHELISLEDGRCRKATVCVTYFHVVEKKATATESLHYDFVLPPQSQHPVCHVQTNNSPVADWPESFDYQEVDASALKSRLRNVRIPSAYVNLPGLLVILAADHMSKKHWRGFMVHCLEHFRQVPAVGNHDVVDKRIHRERLSVWGWYAM